MKDAMKKAFALSAALLLAAFVFCGCAIKPEPKPWETLEIQEGSHSREEGYAAQFSTHYLSGEGIELHMDNSIYAEDELRDAYYSVSALLGMAEAITGQKPGGVKLYMVKTTVGGAPAAVGDSAFFTPEELRNGSAAGALIGAAYSLPAAWQREGLAGLLYGEGQDEAALKGYFSDPANALSASMNAVFFDREFAGEDTVRSVKSAAASLASFAMEKRGFAGFAAASDNGELLPDWLAAIGVEGGAELPEGASAAAEAVLSRGTRYPVISFGRFTMTVPSDGFAQSAEELYKLECGLSRTAELLIERFREETPSLLPEIEERLESGIYVILTDPYLSSSYANPNKGEISLSKPYNAPHELVHVLLREDAPLGDTYWMTEALAEYYSLEAQTRTFPQYDLTNGFDGYLEFFREISGKAETEDDLAFHRAVWSIYEHLRSGEVTKDGRDDSDAYEYAYGIAQLLLTDLDREQIRFMYDRSVAWGYGIADGPKEKAGNNLSYPESRAVFEYLAGIFGAEKLTADQVRSRSTTESTGMSWAEIYSGAREYYMKEFGALLP